MLQIERRTVDGVVVLDVHGHVDMGNCARLHEALVHEVDEGQRKLLLNLKSLSFIDSSCLGVLLRGLERVNKEEGTLLLVGNQFVDRVLTLTGLTHLLVTYASEEDALEVLQGEPPGRRTAAGS